MNKSNPFEDGIGPALVYFAMRAAAWLAEHAPIALGDRIAYIGGRVAYRVSKRKREIVRRNMARVGASEGDLEQLVRRAFDSYARYWLETFRVGRYSRDEILEMVFSDSTDVFEAALATGKGPVIVTAHFGFYDLGVAWIGAKGYPLAAVAEVLRPRALFEWFASIRTKRGMAVLPAKPREYTRQKMLEFLQSGTGVALLSDRDLGRRGVWAELFGEKTTLPIGPAYLLIKTNAPLLSAGIYQTDKQSFRIDFEKIPYQLSGNESHDISAIAQTIAEAVEKMVLKAPEQWHLFSTNWPSNEPHLPPRGANA